jgi:sugar phosphate isomerase/epimerase
MNDNGVELLGSYWTLAGDVEPVTGREWSLFDFRDRVAAAARIGFSGFGIWHADLYLLLEERSLHDVKQILDEHEIKYLELEFLQDWFVDEGDEKRKASDELRRMLLEATEALDAKHIKVGNLVGTPCPIEQITEEFARLCADAAEHGTDICYELMPFDPNVTNVDDLLTVVEGAGAENGGLIMDPWHVVKLKIPFDDLRRIPARYLKAVELDDGYLESTQDLLTETLHHRKLCGEGEFDVKGFIQVLQDIGYGGPWGVEVLSAELRKLPMDEMITRAYNTTMAQFQ